MSVDPVGVGESVSVVVPTYRRPESLARCLDGLARQSTAPAEVIVVRRPDDVASVAVLDRHSGVQGVLVDRPGVVAAMAAGAAATHGEIVAFCDDDAVPRPDWVARLGTAFVDPRLGALGGRDLLGPPHPVYSETNSAGILGAWGRLEGDHHRVVGAPREVDVLKAVNMAFRAAALRFPSGLRGAGAQVHFELPMCLAAIDAGWSVQLDPTLIVDHHPDGRFDADRRGRPAAQAVSDAAFNYTFGLLSARPGLRWRRVAFGVLVGDTGSPGFARAGVGLVLRDLETARRLGPALHGQAAALWSLLRGRRLELRAPNDRVPAG